MADITVHLMVKRLETPILILNRFFRLQGISGRCHSSRLWVLSERSEFSRGDECWHHLGGSISEAIDLMGDKMTARKTMKNAGVLLFRRRN